MLSGLKKKKDLGNVSCKKRERGRQKKKKKENKTIKPEYKYKEYSKSSECQNEWENNVQEI